jgi:hypothetical protein
MRIDRPTETMIPFQLRTRWPENRRRIPGEIRTVVAIADPAVYAVMAIVTGKHKR